MILEFWEEAGEWLHGQTDRDFVANGTAAVIMMGPSALRTRGRLSGGAVQVLAD